jgi:hypothetical protein
VIPETPEDVDSYDFFCNRCVNRMLFLPSAYHKYIYYTDPPALKRAQPDECPVAQMASFEKFPYHIFMSEPWFKEKCECANCIELYESDEMYFLQHGPKPETESIMAKIEEEGERIFETELEDAEVEESSRSLLQNAGIDQYPHDVQIEIANGLNVLKESLEIAMLRRSEINMDDVENFKQELSRRLAESRRDRNYE